MNNLTYYYLNDGGFRDMLNHAWGYYRFQRAWLPEEEDIPAFLMAPHDFERDSLYGKIDELNKKVIDLQARLAEYERGDDDGR